MIGNDFFLIYFLCFEFEASTTPFSRNEESAWVHDVFYRLFVALAFVDMRVARILGEYFSVSEVVECNANAY